MSFVVLVDLGILLSHTFKQTLNIFFFDLVPGICNLVPQLGNHDGRESGKQVGWLPPNTEDTS